MSEKTAKTATTETTVRTAPQHVEIYMPIDRKDTRTMELDPGRLSIRHIRVKNVLCYRLPGTPDFAEAYERLLETEARAESREKRCLLPDRHGGLVRCPAENSCKDCEKCLDAGFTTNHPLSYEKLTQGDSEDDRILELPDRSEFMEDVHSSMLLENLTAYLATFPDPSYVPILRLLYEQYEIREIAARLGIPWSTAKDRVTRVRKILQEYLEAHDAELYRCLRSYVKPKTGGTRKT